MARFGQLVVVLALGHVCALAMSDVASLVRQKPASKGARFADGDRVEIPVQMRGDSETTWIPATIARSRFAGFYDVKVALGRDGQYSIELPGMAADLPRMPSEVAWDMSSRHYASSPADAQRVLEHIKSDIRSRAQASLHAQGLTKHQVGKKMATWDKAQIAKQGHETRVHGCPAGYRAVAGDGKGSDQFGRADKVRRETIDLCKQDCEKQPKCLSFEWSPHTKGCNLNKVSEPDTTHNFMDFLYCQRLSKIAAPHRHLGQAVPKEAV